MILEARWHLEQFQLHSEGGYTRPDFHEYLTHAFADATAGRKQAGPIHA